MLREFRASWKLKWRQARSFLTLKIIKALLHLIMKSCRIQIVGLDLFCEAAKKEKCMLMLWHNRLFPFTYILSKYTTGIRYAALVSGSRDGDILSALISSYENGSAIRAPHLGRYQALREVVRRVDSKRQVVVITPDGPRGPRYEFKPGIALAALETGASLFSLDWEASHYWELKTWDRFRIPKPFTTVRIIVGPPLCFDKERPPTLEEAIALLKNNLLV